MVERDIGLLGERIFEQHLGCTSYIAQHMFFDYKYMDLLAQTIAKESDSISSNVPFAGMIGIFNRP